MPAVQQPVVALPRVPVPAVAPHVLPLRRESAFVPLMPAAARPVAVLQLGSASVPQMHAVVPLAVPRRLASVAAWQMPAARQPVRWT